MDSSKETLFTLIFTCKEVKNSNNYTLTDKGEKVIPYKSHWGPTSRNAPTGRPSGEIEALPDETLVWESKELAKEFGDKWLNGEHHPWYHEPISYEIIELEPEYVTTLSHYKVKQQ